MQPLGSDDPRQIGPYRITAALGAGGMGRVYLGRSRAGRLVAVKVVHAELAADPDFRARFAREAAAARAVGGAHTAAVIDVDAQAPRPWLATVYVPGPSLAEAIAAHGPFPPRSLHALAAGLAEALQAVHAERVVHRDLKPSNVLLTFDGPRIIDFGIARALDGTLHTRSELLLGSPGFMAPEQLETDAPVGPPCDVFCLGLVVATAAGARPFGEGPAQALMFRVAHREPDLTDVPEPLRHVVAACLVKDPVARPAPAQVLDLLGAVGEDPGPGWLPQTVQDMITARAADVLRGSAGEETADAQAPPPAAGPLPYAPTEPAAPRRPIPPPPAEDPLPHAPTEAMTVRRTPPTARNRRRFALGGGAVVVAVVIALVALLVTSSSGSGHAGGSAGAASTTTPSLDVHIGFDGPLTGSLATMGSSAQVGATLAIDKANRTHEVPGATFQLTSEDDKGNAAAAHTALNILGNDPNLAGIVGPLQSSAAANPPTAAVDVAMVSPTATDPTLTAPNTGSDTFFRVCSDDDAVWGYAADYVAHTLHITKVATVDDGQAYARSWIQEFTTRFSQDGGTVTVTRTLMSGADPTPVASAVKAADPQLVVDGSADSSEAGKLSAALQSAGVPIPLLGSDSYLSSGYLTAAGSAADMDYAVSDTTPADKLPGVTQLASEAQTDGVAGAQGPETAAGFDAAWAIIEAVKAAHPVGTGVGLRAAVLHALPHVSFAGVSGPVAFDAHGDTTNVTASIHKVVDGAWYYQASATPGADPTTSAD